MSESHPNKFLKSLGALRLDNQGAVARDHLANERTYLAWLRTSLSFASIGVAVTQFFRLQSSTNIKNLIEASQALSSAGIQVADPTSSSSLLIQTPAFYHYIEKITIQDKKLVKISTVLGSWFIVTAVVIMLLGMNRYFVTQHFLRKGVFPVSRVSVTFLFAITLALIITNLVVVLKL